MSLISSIKFNGCPRHVKDFGNGRSVALYKKEPKVVFALKG
jgi:hypothetical protein